MIANLPLLFANGNPTALSKITAPELEKFITFMVTCSWGHDTAKDILKPPWWPTDVPFSHPFKRPKVRPRDWDNKLKRLVRKCYDYHKSAFLLVFSAQLARYPHNRLRYVDNLDHTTSLYSSGKLLVTFRNENLHYDRKPEYTATVAPQPRLKSTDIYLCDNCDSHFDNFDMLKVHERLCNNEDVPSTNVSGGLPEFLSALKLKPIIEEEVNTNSKDDDTKPRHSRSGTNIDRGPPYPFSSLAYLRSAKANIQKDTNNSYSRERVERYCCDMPNTTAKYVGSKSKTQHFPVRFRRPIDYWQRKHVFPYQRNKEILDLKGQLMLLKCRPVSVHVERMSQESMQEYIDKLREEAKARADSMEDIEFIGGFSADHVVDDSVKGSDPLNHGGVECEVIDLCSDDETPSANENCDPRAGVTCVMRGGAVLRRTAATAESIPAEPCGARQKPLAPAILQPHPVILFTHSLSNLQTISID